MLRCINRLEEPTSGSIVVEGVDVCAKGVDLNKVRTHLGMVFQQFNLFPHLSVKKNVMLAQQKVLKRSKEEAEKIAIEELTKVGLPSASILCRVSFRAVSSSAWPSPAPCR